MADSIQCGIHSLMNIHKSVVVDLIFFFKTLSLGLLPCSQQPHPGCYSKHECFCFYAFMIHQVGQLATRSKVHTRVSSYNLHNSVKMDT